MEKYIKTNCKNKKIVPFKMIVSINKCFSDYHFYTILGQLEVCDEENYKKFIDWLQDNY